MAMKRESHAGHVVMVPTGPKCDLDGRAVVTRSHPNALRELPSHFLTAVVAGVWWQETIGETIVFGPLDCNFLQSTE